MSLVTYVRKINLCTVCLSRAGVPPPQSDPKAMQQQTAGKRLQQTQAQVNEVRVHPAILGLFSVGPIRELAYSRHVLEFFTTCGTWAPNLLLIFKLFFDFIGYFFIFNVMTRYRVSLQIINQN